MRRIKHRLAAALLAVAALAAVAVAPAAAPAAQGDLEGGRLTNCFFHYGAVGVSDYNIAYPDAGATYWAAFVRRPAGSTLKLHGTFPHSRYMSVISYDSAGQFVDGLADYQLTPDAGSSNPFLSGADRTTADANRQYTVNLLNARATSDGTATGADLFSQSPKNNEAVRNDLYARPRTPLAEVLGATDPAVIRGEYPTGPVQLELVVLRNYVQDNGTDLNGNEPLPTPELTLSNGTTLTGQAACDRMDSESKDYKVLHAGAPRLPDPASLLLNQQGWDALRYPDNPTALPTTCNLLATVGCTAVVPPFAPAAPTQLASTPLVAVPRTPGSLPATFPAQNPANWRAQYSRRYLLQAWAGDDAPGAETAPVRSGGGGFFPNIHNNYVRTLINRKFGKVFVMHGKLPTSPVTSDGEATMGSWAGGGYQDRYTSICMNESPRTTRVQDCAYDENIPIDANRFYTAAVSRTEDRPANATTFCGIAWIQWSPYGDGSSRLGDALTDDDGGVVQIRDMLPDPSFAQAIQNTHIAGDEKAVMGDYLPDTSYSADAASFEASQGCDWANPGVPHLDAGSSTPNAGQFTLAWDPTQNAVKFPNMRYSLQHKNASGSWADVATDLSSPSYTFASGTPEAEGTWTYRVTAHDGTAQSGTAGASSEVKVDTSGPNAPTGAATRAADYAGNGGWFKDSVTVAFSDNGDAALADGSAGSGVDAGSLPAPQSVSADGASTVSGTVKDVVGNTSASGSLGVQVDAAAPTLSVTCPAVVLLNAPASATTTAADGGSGLAADPSGSTAISTSTVGSKTITKTATDNVGHSVTTSCTTKVQYMYSGLLAPIKPNGSSVFEKGKVVPVTFRLTDFLSHSAPGALATLSIANVVNDVVGPYAPAVSAKGAAQGNRFTGLPLGLYSFDLKTTALSAGLWSLKVSLNDGTEYTTRISLKKS